MKYFSGVLIAIAVAVIIYNSTLINVDAPFEEESLIALIGIVSALCAILLLVVFMLSRKIQRKIKKS
ncbi:MAG: hypothetical protein KDD04_05020 [Sinomicrobium sp.]|nr:hypothetical protein [Sinomicrobium sp.]